MWASTRPASSIRRKSGCQYEALKSPTTIVGPDASRPISAAVSRSWRQLSWLTTGSRVQGDDADVAVRTIDRQIEAVVVRVGMLADDDGCAAPQGDTAGELAAAIDPVRVVVGQVGTLECRLMLGGVLAEHDDIRCEIGEGVGDLADAVVAIQQIHRCHPQADGLGDRIRLLIGEGERCGEDEDAEPDGGAHGRQPQPSTPQRHEGDGDDQ